MTTSMETGDGRSTLRFDHVLPHGRDRVWRAVTDPAELQQWFPSAVIYEPRVGAPMSFDFGGDHGVEILPGEVLAWDPPNVFAFAWGKDELRFTLSDAPEGTRLVFEHSFAHEPGKEARDSAGWAACFDAFHTLLSGDGEPAMGDWQGYEVTFLERYGDLTLDDGRVVRLSGPLLEHEGRPAIAVAFEGREGVLVVPEGAFADGAAVELRDGDIGAPGAVFASGVLRDPLVRR
jgi:uncharacterized protein YndB with AHSA1/START domain